jgi:hypothetical protein
MLYRQLEVSISRVLSPRRCRRDGEAARLGQRRDMDVQPLTGEKLVEDASM